MVEFLTFEAFHGKKNTGSTNIRVHQLLKYWPEAREYKYGSNPEVLVFQKVYWLPDYRFMEHFKGIKVLDICDPDWLDNAYIKRTVNYMDAVVVPTKALKEFIEQLTDKPVKVIKDRFDVDKVPTMKLQTKPKQLKAVWFGYSHNAEVLGSSGAVRALEKLGMSLKIMSNDDPLAWRWAEDEEKVRQTYNFKKYKEETIYDELQCCDICILPKGNRPVDHFKSNNKTTKAFLASLPVARDLDQLEKYLDLDARNKSIEYNYNRTIKEYDVKLSVKEYKDLINELYSRD